MIEGKKKRKIKFLTFEDRNLLEKYGKDFSLTYKEIGKKINRAVSTIADEFRRNGGRKNYSAQEVERRAKQAKSAKKEKVKTNILSSIERIEALEQQVEILFETLKGLRNDSANKKL